MIVAAILVVFNLATLLAGLSIGEFEYAKYVRPDAGWFVTPQLADSLVAGSVTILAVFCLALLVFVLMRRLTQYLKLISLLSLAQVLILGSLWWLLGERFLAILWPTWR